jgi:hypothetical protein
MRSAEGRMFGQAPIDNAQICLYGHAYHEHPSDGTAVPQRFNTHRSASLHGDECEARLPHANLARAEPAKSIGPSAKVVLANGPFRPLEAARNGPTGWCRPRASKAEDGTFKPLISWSKKCIYNLFIHCGLAHLRISFLTTKERQVDAVGGRLPNARARAWVVLPWIVINDL